MAANADDRDLELIAAVQRGERPAWTSLVERHERWLRGVVYSTLGNAGGVDDVLQQVWLQAWQQIGTLADRGKWRGWLYRLARNAAIDSGKSAARRRPVARPMTDQAAAGAAGGPIPSHSALQAERQEQILRAVQSLPAIYREPFILRHLEDWTYAQIADALDMPVDTVETRLVRARRLLREALAGEEQAYRAE